jgi:hypothetical protein
MHSGDQYEFGAEFIGHCVQLPFPYGKLVAWSVSNLGIARLNLNWNLLRSDIRFTWRKVFLALVSPSRLHPHKTTNKITVLWLGNWTASYFKDLLNFVQN